MRLSPVAGVGFSIELASADRSH